MSRDGVALNRIVTGARQYSPCPVSSWLAQVRRVLHRAPPLRRGSPFVGSRKNRYPAAATDPLIHFIRYPSNGTTRPGAVLTVANKPPRGLPMTVNVVLLQPLIALIAGILILLTPRLLNYIVAIYLIIIGLAGLLPHILR